MAQFSGTGAFIIGGAPRLYDIDFANTGGLVSTGSGATISHCEGNINIQGSGSSLTECVGITPVVTGDSCRIVNNLLSNLQDGLVLNADGCLVVGNDFSFNGAFPTNTYDCLVINGDRNLVTANKFHPSVGNTRYGVNVASGECNQVVGNDLGDPDDYATDALVDNGSNTQLFWPADATYGDNFVDCGSGS